MKKFDLFLSGSGDFRRPFCDIGAPGERADPITYNHVMLQLVSGLLETRLRRNIVSSRIKGPLSPLSAWLEAIAIISRGSRDDPTSSEGHMGQDFHGRAGLGTFSLAGTSKNDEIGETARSGVDQL